jgi:hypothetical protein
MGLKTQLSSRRSRVSSIPTLFRLNPANPREKVILDFLALQVDNRGASAAIKRALYEKVTGCDWDTGRPLVLAPLSGEPDHASPPSLTSGETKRQRLAEIEAGFSDWFGQ